MDRILTGEQLINFNDRLVLAFRGLRKNNNFITRQSFQNDTSSAITALVDMLDKAAKEGKRRSGAVYYHRNDRANISFGKVAIRFTDYVTKDCSQEQSDANAVAIGREIVIELERAGLFHYWDESPNSVVWAFLLEEDAKKMINSEQVKVG